MSPAAEGILRRLDGLRQQWWLFTFLTTGVWAIATSAVLLLLLMLSDALLMFSQLALMILLGVWAVVTIGLALVAARRVVQRQRGLEGAARRVEFECPELGSSLLNLVQLSDDTANENRAFCDAAVSEAAARLSGFPLNEAARRETRWGRFRYCMQTPRDLLESFGMLALVVGVAVACHLCVPNWGSAANRLMRPWEYIPSVGSVGAIKVTPGNAELLIGSTLEILAEIANPEATECHGAIFVLRDGLAQDGRPERQEEMPLSADTQRRQFKIALPSLEKGLKYRIQIGDSQTAEYTVAVLPKPTFSEVAVTYRYPAYLGLPSATMQQKTADLESPLGAEAELRLRPTTPIDKAYLELGGQRIVGTVEDGGRLAVLKTQMFRDASFTVNLVTRAGHSDPNPRLNRIRVLLDQPPGVQLLKPGLQSTAPPGGDVAVVVKATDDHAVGQVRLEMQIVRPAAEGAGAAAADAAPTAVVQQWEKFEGTTNVLLNHRLTLPADKAKPGDTVKLRAVAVDKRFIFAQGLQLRPQETAGPWHSIRVVAEEKQLQAALERLDSLRGAIFKILEQQIAARVKTASLLQREHSASAADVRNEQVAIQKAGMAVAASIRDVDAEERLAIKRAMNGLAVGEMVEAVRQCDAILKINDAAGLAQPIPRLTAVQDKIIDVLRRMLNEARKAQTEALAEAPKRPGGDLPNDTKEKLENAKEKLEAFLKQQKKIIEASENLAKKPVEDFTDKEEQALKGMAASEADWSKMMKDLHSDLSKLPEQDFANSSMAKELNEVQTELKIAADALLKKATDVAVPLEQLGYENAQELMTNIEKWLPDEPDRTKWSQEEALGDDNKEAPMAELPTELEDLIGELAEEEEDLMAESQDVSSSAIDSPDKGVGWDASDGPISSNAAKGVTGNTLPNTNEVGGRSGEGRSAKSSGEFVGDEAVGKGGRKTPARLTPDPYVKGQIQDHSKDDGGGATGGGKESGQGEEGLEGPTPRGAGSREMGRLAGKQAALRNKAEGVDLQFQVNGYHRTDLKKLIDVMSQVERDLRAGRYQNVLRQRQVLAEGLGSVKQYLKGEFQVRRDSTANLPADIQKELLGAMQDACPAGWEDVNREYFSRLSGGDSDASGPPATELKK